MLVMLGLVGVVVQVISYKNGNFGTYLYLLTRIMGFFQTTEYGISLGEIMSRIQRDSSSTARSRSNISLWSCLSNWYVRQTNIQHVTSWIAFGRNHCLYDLHLNEKKVSDYPTSWISLCVFK
jgi:hypothetical protein